MDEPVKKPRGRPKKEEAEKRPVGRPKKEKPAEEPTEPKRGRGRPKKAPEEKAVRKSRAKPKEPEVGKVLVRETAVTHPAGSGELLRPPPPAFVEPPRPAVVAKDPITGEFPVKAGIDITLPSPPPELDLPSDEEEARRMTEDYYAQQRAQEERERIRKLQRAKREAERKEEERVARISEETRRQAEAYRTFRDSFRTPTAYKHWEERMLDEINKNYNPGSGIPSDEKAFFLVLSDAGVPALAQLSFSRAISLFNGGDWSKLKQSDRIVPDLGIKHIGYLGSGDFKNEEQYDRLEARRLRIFPPEEEAERMGKARR